MTWWNHESRWVSEDGLRWYFPMRGGKGPSQLDCYRRLLGEADAEDARRQTAPFVALRWSTVLEFARGGWRRHPAAIATVFQIVGL